MDHPYGYCPVCGAPGVLRERGPDGNDKCENGHVYPSKDAVQNADGSYVLGGLLSNAALGRKAKDYAAKCDKCQTVWVDDVGQYGSIRCPNCKGIALVRGITFEEFRKLTGQPVSPFDQPGGTEG